MPDILIFDDDPHIPALLGDVLREQGFSVAHYPSADGIIQIVHDNKPRLIILDIMMPGIDGLSACRDIRSNMATRHIKVVVITAKQFEQDRITAQRYGVSLFVNKPFHPVQLAQNISSLLGATQPASGPAAPAPPLTVAFLPWGAAVESLDLWLLLDAGRGLGSWVSSHNSIPRLCWQFLSRYEPEAVEELGAGAALLCAGGSVKLAGPEDADSTLSRLASRLSAGLPLEAMRPALAFPPKPKSTPLLYPLREGEFLVAPGIMGTARYTQHPGSALAYRFDMHGRRLVYCPCHEIDPDYAQWNQHETRKFKALFDNADVLIHGFSRSLQQPRPSAGPGAAWEPVVDMAMKARVRQLWLQPLGQTADQDIPKQAHARTRARHSGLRCALALPGASIVL